jgi:ferredoxin-NADP reductase
MVPDIADGDVYVCGPTGFDEAVVDAATRLGVRRDQLHLEAFSF